MFSCEFYEISKKTCFKRPPPLAASDGLQVNVIYKVLEVIKEALVKTFNDSINFKIFPENMKIA